MLSIQGWEQVKDLLNKLTSWGDGGFRKDLVAGAEVLVKDYRKKIRKGQNADGSPLAPLRDSTLKGPIRRETDTRTRQNYGESPLSATGKLEESIAIISKSGKEIVIGANNAYGDKILASNATSSHAGDRPFTGDVKKAIRDPLQVTEVQMDIIEEALVDGLERMLR